MGVNEQNVQAKGNSRQEPRIYLNRDQKKPRSQSVVEKAHLVALRRNGVSKVRGELKQAPDRLQGTPSGIASTAWVVNGITDRMEK